MEISKKKKALDQETARKLMEALDHKDDGMERAFADLFSTVQNKTLERFQSLLMVLPPIGE